MPVLAVGLAGVAGALTLASQDVLPPSHRFDVPGIHARAIPAEVVEGQPVGDRADQLLVEHPVCAVLLPPDLQRPVSVVQMEFPDPTMSRRIFGELFEIAAVPLALVAFDESVPHRLAATALTEPFSHGQAPPP
jgi:hypothetical protein